MIFKDGLQCTLRLHPEGRQALAAPHSYLLAEAREALAKRAKVRGQATPNTAPNVMANRLLTLLAAPLACRQTTPDARKRPLLLCPTLPRRDGAAELIAPTR